MTAAGAADHGVPKKRIEAVVKAYVGTIGCLLNLDRQNIVKFGVNDEGATTYVALFSIDPNCSGGSAMAHSAIALLERTSGGIFIRPAQSFPVASSRGLPQYVERIYVQGDHLRYSGKEFDVAKDPLCCPSIQVKGELMLIDGVWSAISENRKKQ